MAVLFETIGAKEMKSKKIGITYTNNGNMKSIASKEFIFRKLLTEMQDEGRVVINTSLNSVTKSARFNDGSSIDVFPLNYQSKGKKFTHVYVDESIYDLSNGVNFVKKFLIPLMIGQGKYETIEAEEPVADRIFMYALSNSNSLDIQKF